MRVDANGAEIGARRFGTLALMLTLSAGPAGERWRTEVRILPTTGITPTFRSRPHKRLCSTRGGRERREKQTAIRYVYCKIYEYNPEGELLRETTYNSVIFVIRSIHAVR